MIALIGFIEGAGVLSARFADGRRVDIHRGSGAVPGRFYVLRAGDQWFTGDPAPTPEESLAYQREALAAFLSGAEHVARRDEDGVLVVDVREAV